MEYLTLAALIKLRLLAISVRELIQQQIDNPADVKVAQCLLDLGEAQVLEGILGCYVIQSGEVPTSDFMASLRKEPRHASVAAHVMGMALVTMATYGNDLNLQGARTGRSSAARPRIDYSALHRPAVEGTVAELCAKYGKSKSEIRRLKAANLLHTLDANHEGQATAGV